ncbi:Gfo/Idh/MocA family oxidoreductase, partial [bacterium]|nr:Gfo/Idh/MocA family oxidoreductase [bacterium]
MSDKRIPRRTFAWGTATAAALVVSRHVLGKSATAPSDKLNVACIGCGGMGANDVRSVESENVVALCDVDEARAADTFKRLSRVRKFKDYRRMLDAMDKQIDAVTVSTPDHTHFPAAMKAIGMGKHAFVQKPLAHTIAEARQLTLAARQAKVATQMGIQGNSFEGLRLLREWLADGVIGPVREVHAWTNKPVWPQGIGRPADKPPVPKTLDWNLWLGTAPLRPYHPAYLPFAWRGWWDFGSCSLGDMGCHVLN